MSDAHSQPSDPTHVCGSSTDGSRRQEVTARDGEGHTIKSVRVHKTEEGGQLPLDFPGLVV